MASINVAKYGNKGIAALRVHLDQSERIARDHANKDIDKERTHENYFIGCNDWNDMYTHWQNRNEEADRLHPPDRMTKDRTTGLMIELGCMWEIVKAGRELEFFTMLYEYLGEKFGPENVHGLVVHHDEVHNYLDRGEEKTSMIHAHALVTPYAHWSRKDGTEREGINGKNCLTRQFLRELQKDFNELHLREFGIEYNTHGLQQHKTVEQLKFEGEALAKQQAIERMIQRNQEVEYQADVLERKLKEINEKLSEANLERLRAEADIDYLLKEKEALEVQIRAHSDSIRIGRAVDIAAEAIRQTSSLDMDIDPISGRTLVNKPPKEIQAAFIALKSKEPYKDEYDKLEAARMKGTDFQIKAELAMTKKELNRYIEITNQMVAVHPDLRGLVDPPEVEHKIDHDGHGIKMRM